MNTLKFLDDEKFIFLLNQIVNIIKIDSIYCFGMLEQNINLLLEQPLIEEYFFLLIITAKDEVKEKSDVLDLLRPIINGNLNALIIVQDFTAFENAKMTETPFTMEIIKKGIKFYKGST